MKCLVPLLISLYKCLAEVKEAALMLYKTNKILISLFAFKNDIYGFFLSSIQLYTAYYNCHIIT